ncbi:MAG: hypothetical protein ACR2F1_05320 [Nitrososphaeraceae archaeon]
MIFIINSRALFGVAIINNNIFSNVKTEWRNKEDNITHYPFS